MTWFTQLTGIEEHSPDGVRSQIGVEDECLTLPDGRRVAFGRLETPTLGELRQQVSENAVSENAVSGGRATLRELVGDVRKLHADPENAGALFQVASQFNLLEMASPSATPELGVGIYQDDPTQGPACAIACGAGTIYRNYFAPVENAVGQSANQQIDCSADLGELLGNVDVDGDVDGNLWKMQNGYLFPSDLGLQRINAAIQNADAQQIDRYRASLRIGLQWDAAVTLPKCTHRVSQAYCSALPVAYGRQPEHLWKDLAVLVLEAAYEATLCASILNGSSKLFLTLLGGGVFGNADEWITAAIQRAILKYRDYDLDVAIVSYGRSQRSVTQLVAELQ